VAPMAYPVLAQDRAVRFAGGAEVQQVAIATALLKRGLRVSMICHDHGFDDGATIRGVRLWKMCAPSAGLPGVRFLHPRLTSLWAAMRRADADIYYQRTSGAATAFVAAFARRHGRQSIFAGAHDDDFEPDLPLIRYARDKLLYRWGLRNVSRVVVQTERQKQRCLAVYGRESVRIDSCYAHAGEPASHEGDILWVATVKPMKRPELFIELARRLPARRFRLVGGTDGSSAGQAYYDRIAAMAAALPNLRMTGFVPTVDVERHFDGASVFVNTSSGEGFPNTFLQAWSRGIPTVSFFDPGSRMDGRPVGFVVSDADRMTAAVAALKDDSTLWHVSGALAQSYFERHHSAERIAAAYERLIADLRPRRPGSGTAMASAPQP
jgi:glycosyltransferase involved in cell wall biosynthesis